MMHGLSWSKTLGDLIFPNEIDLSTEEKQDASVKY